METSDWATDKARKVVLPDLCLIECRPTSKKEHCWCGAQERTDRAIFATAAALRAARDEGLERGAEKLEAEVKRHRDEQIAYADPSTCPGTHCEDYGCTSLEELAAAIRAEKSAAANEEG